MSKNGFGYLDYKRQFCKIVSNIEFLKNEVNNSVDNSVDNSIDKSFDFSRQRERKREGERVCVYQVRSTLDKFFLSFFIKRFALSFLNDTTLFPRIFLQSRNETIPSIEVR